MEHFDMAFGFYIEGFFHRTSLNQDRNVTIQYIHFLLCVCYHHTSCPDTGNTDDDASHQEEGAYYHHQLDFVFEILDNHSFTISIIYNTLLIIPCVDTFACCATPSPKLRVENAVSPSGIIHAARSGTRFRHLSATMLAAIR